MSSHSSSGIPICRDLTGVYMRYRQEQKAKKNRFASSFLSESGSLTTGNIKGGSQGNNSEHSSARLLNNQILPQNNRVTASHGSGALAVELDNILPPKWVDISGEIQDIMGKIKDKIRLLKHAQQKRLRSVFGSSGTSMDSSGGAGSENREIEILSSTIADLFRSAEGQIKLLPQSGNEGGPHNNISKKEQTIRSNTQRALATRLQSLSLEFRGIQKDFVESLKKRDAGVWDDEKDNKKGGGGGSTSFFDDPQMDSGGSLIDGIGTGSGMSLTNQQQAQLTQQQIQELEEVEFSVGHRTEEIRKIAQSVTELHTLFKDLAVLVIDQGTMLDRIDYNVEQVVVQSKEANVQLKKAEAYHKSNRALKCIYFLSAGIFVEILLLFLKWS